MHLSHQKPGRMYPAANIAPYIARDTGNDPRLAVRKFINTYLYIKEALPCPIKNAAQGVAAPCTATE